MFLTACDVDFYLKMWMNTHIRWKYVECLPVENESTPWDDTQHTQRVPHIIMCTQKKTLIFICKLPINKIKGYLYSILSLSGQSSGSTYRVPDILNGPDKDTIENKMPFILYILSIFITSQVVVVLIVIRLISIFKHPEYRTISNFKLATLSSQRFVSSQQSSG